MATRTYSVPEHRDPARAVAELCLIAAVMFVASYVGILFIDQDNGVAPIWIANAILIYFILRNPAADTFRVIAVGITARFCAGLVIGSAPIT
ncbi:MAG TPA: hypothetical protein VKB71_11120, partial [Rhizomicrobium sp.]|nr:hypothetical protein [Rhizomicrobium sp.]